MPSTRYQGRFLRLVEDEGWEYVERVNTSGVVVVVAVTDQREVLLVEQFRRPVGTTVIEMPAGLAGDFAAVADEPLEAAAHRELLEETGYRARGMRRVTAGPVSAGMSTECLTFFVADGIERVGEGGGDDSEDITTYRVPISEVVSFCQQAEARGALVDPKVFAGLFFVVGDRA